MNARCADLSGKTFIVTGGTQGLGEDIARFAAACDAGGLTICGRNPDKGCEVAAALEAAGCPTLFVEVDLVEPDACRRVVNAHEARFGRLYGLANVAASTARGTLDSTTVEAWDRMFALNVRAPFVLIQEAARLMRRSCRGGSIVNISSISGRGGQSFLTAYSTSKGALNTLTKNAAHALTGDRIRVNALNLGWMATPGEHAVQLAAGKPENWLEDADASAPFGRILRPREVSRLVAILWSADSMVTGSVIDWDYLVIGAKE